MSNSYVFTLSLIMQQTDGLLVSIQCLCVQLNKSRRIHFHVMVHQKCDGNGELSVSVPATNVPH